MRRKGRMWVVLLIAVSAAGCIPARLPAVLDATAGSPVQVDGGRVTTTAFSAAYPHGWRVILSPADQPPFVTMAAQDNCTVILVSSAPVEAPPMLPDSCVGDVLTINDTVTVDEVMLYLAAASNTGDTLQATLTTIMESLTLP